MTDRIIQNLVFLANRFAEANEPHMSQPVASAIADRCYPQKGFGVELAHIVLVNETDVGILLEYEYDDEYRPGPEAVTVWRETPTTDGVIRDAYDGALNFDGRWVMATFIPLAVAMAWGHTYVEILAEELWVAASKCAVRLPTPAYVVDGHESQDDDSMLAGDGQFPPFWIFHPASQTSMPTSFATRDAAQKIADWMNNHA